MTKDIMNNHNVMVKLFSISNNHKIVDDEIQTLLTQLSQHFWYNCCINILQDEKKQQLLLFKVWTCCENNYL